MSGPGSGPSAYLNAVSVRDIDATLDTTLDKASTGSGIYTYLSVRRTGNDEYLGMIRWLPNGEVTLQLSKRVNGTGTSLRSVRVAGLNAGAGDTMRLRLQVFGTGATTLNAKVWKVGTAEPAAWIATATDGQATLQVPGAIGLKTYLSSDATNAPVTALFDNLNVNAFNAVPPGNQPPVARFTATSTGLAAAFDGASSTDPDGSVATYDWSFGDGSTTSARAPGHTYSSPGSYAVQLTVTDDGGQSDSTAKTVYVSPSDAVPRPDHVVIVVMENRSSINILGNTNAPYINSLANSGANMTQSFAETHPSQPNYLALFSGDTQGVADDSCPHTFTNPSLYDQLASAGLGFTGFAEGLPAVGSTVCRSGKYVRKHNPWVNWSSVPPSASQPFAAFPSDFSALPEVSFVIPDLDNDMHDGSIAQGDSWLQTNMGAYVTWANTHNSLFVLTWDEDDNNDNNQIPTIVTGQHVARGNFGDRINHYNVLRTVQDAFDLGTIGNSVSKPPITSIWATGANQPPVAAFTSSVAGTGVSLDGSSSSDPDGAIVAWAWNFGDQTAAGAGETTSHTYAAAGAYTVTLTVTDNKGATATAEAEVTVPAGAVTIASDDFGRTVANGWGSADTGGAWSIVGSRSNFAVANGSGSITMAHAGAGPSVYLNGVSSSDSDVQVTLTTDKAPTGGGVSASVIGRQVAGVGGYRAAVNLAANGTVRLSLARVDGAGHATIVPAIAIPGLIYSAGDLIDLRFQVTGTAPTHLQAKAWKHGAAEPTSWSVVGVDSSAPLQTPGSVGLMSYLSGTSNNAPVVTRFDGFRTYKAAIPPDRGA